MSVKKWGRGGGIFNTIYHLKHFLLPKITIITLVCLSIFLLLPASHIRTQMPRLYRPASVIEK